jgi:hypothetical protein
MAIRQCAAVITMFTILYFGASALDWPLPAPAAIANASPNTPSSDRQQSIALMAATGIDRCPSSLIRLAERNA